MTRLQVLLLAVCLAAMLLHLATSIMALIRCRRRRTRPLPQAGLPPVTILRPICGLDEHDPLTLRSSFALDYPHFEVIFCCAQEADPAAALVRQLIADHPQVKARLLLGNSTVSANPKLNNLVKGWNAARCDWIIMADSNVLMPPDYIQRLLSGWRSDTGILCSPPIGCMGRGFWAELECAFLNTYQARWQYAADCLGLGFAQGKTMLLRRGDLARAGGIAALAAEAAEDAAATKAVRRMGLTAVLVDAPFGQPLGERTLKQVWNRQARWSRLRRVTFPGYFAAEVLTGSLPPALALACCAEAIDLSPAIAVAALAAVFFVAEAALARAAGWQLTPTSPLAWALRDLMLPALWIHGWFSEGYTWRGSEIRASASGA